MRELTVQEHVPLAARTTLELGGPARFFVEARDEDDAARAIAWAKGRGVSVSLLGGGSNLVVGDAGVDGLVLAVAWRGVHVEAAHFDDGGHVEVTAAAGEPWDAFVAMCVARDLAGLECLSGIPGLVGATPIQNVGAYGQDVSQTIVRIRVLDRTSGEVRTLPSSELGFGYRDSALKQAPDAFVVLDVTFRLERGGAPRLAYAELTRALASEAGDKPTLSQVRDVVLRLRRQKSMVIDPADPNRRSAGSFFTNPLVTPALAEDVVARALVRGVITDAAQLPRWSEPDGRVKLAAGWLIERAGIEKGLRKGAVGISTAHALALVHHGGGTTAELLALEEHVRASVQATWGVTLVREPVLW
jgi:UDP-N-acetylmuramate dehydrogenase